MDYIGEHLLPAKLGHFFAVLSLAASFVAMISYFKATRSTSSEDEKKWKRLGRVGFFIDVIAVFSVFGTIYFIVSNHLFEYNYAWEHSSKALSSKYLLSCIWEAQEGSFLLWTIWHCVLGSILIFTSKRWEGPVMAVISFAQFCLASMILGIYFFGTKVGINPFLLVRERFSEGPMFNRPDYLTIPQMQDGQGLNSLLQNYWMVIHPPVLFLGFASTIVPFAFAISGLWKKQYGTWIKPSLPWTLFSACALGTGVLMGAAWAYESLTFGGYWAWDPVENASLVPWLVLVAGLHTQVIYNATGHSLRSGYIFLMLSFILILYSTFLTRSGILGDSSVHAFVDSGMNFQLLLFIFVFLIPSAILFGKRYKNIPYILKEENTWSREFWMFIGSLVLFLSALFVIISTSLPVINQITGGKLTVGEDVTFAYNRIEIFIAIILGILTALTQYLKYKNTGRDYLVKKIALPTLLAVIISVFVSLFGGIHFDKYGAGFLVAIHLAIFGAVYSVVANAAYLWYGLQGKMKAAGASVAHLGFGLMLLGILLSSAKKEVLSYNTTGINLPFDPKMKENPLENITLLKNVKTDMGKYWATFVNSDSINETGNIRYFQINMEKKDRSEEFKLFPNFIKVTKGDEGYSRNPDKHHYWDRDIFAYLNYADLEKTKDSDTTQFKSYPVAIHDTIYYSKGYMVLNKVTVNPNNDRYHFIASDTALMAEVTLFSKDSMSYQANPLLYVKNNEAHYVIDTVFAQNLALALGRVINNKKIELRVKESTNMVPFVSLKVYEFPQINVLWIGILIMITGFIMSLVRRVKTQGSATA